MTVIISFYNKYLKGDYNERRCNTQQQRKCVSETRTIINKHKGISTLVTNNQCHLKI